MTRRLSPPARLLVAGLIDWTGTGFYLAISAIFLTRAVGLTAAQAGLALAAVGLVAFAGGVPVGRRRVDSAAEGFGSVAQDVAPARWHREVAAVPAVVGELRRP